MKKPLTADEMLRIYERQRNVSVCANLLTMCVMIGITGIGVIAHNAGVIIVGAVFTISDVGYFLGWRNGYSRIWWLLEMALEGNENSAEGS
jgi:hypothetical protein